MLHLTRWKPEEARKEKPALGDRRRHRAEKTTEDKKETLLNRVHSHLRKTMLFFDVLQTPWPSFANH